jgi:hypothetical protein
MGKNVKTKQEIETLLLPDMCYVAIARDNTIGIVKKNEQGYYPVNNIDTKNKLYEELKEIVDILNTQQGITKKEACIMQAKSMFGNW